MGKEMKFSSQICTTRKQSERLLELGIKKETADMWYYKDSYGWRCSPFEEISDEKAYLEYGTPAWSLHRLIEIIGDLFEIPHLLLFNIEVEKGYDYTIDNIEWLIVNGRINKEYLEE